MKTVMGQSAALLSDAISTGGPFDMLLPCSAGCLVDNN
jgi:hypothetical protein